ncbi:hypothetical protein CGRA01v4_03874 [Colletotrichum graminicola]|nr:hypothetical protein CGRA01v4_03874 [Colletotrichum graminicola]
MGRWAERVVIKRGHPAPYVHVPYLDILSWHWQKRRPGRIYKTG